jgi:hypothetical protein
LLISGWSQSGASRKLGDGGTLGDPNSNENQQHVLQSPTLRKPIWNQSDLKIFNEEPPEQNTIQSETPLPIWKLLQGKEQSVEQSIYNTRSDKPNNLIPHDKLKSR